MEQSFENKRGFFYLAPCYFTTGARSTGSGWQPHKAAVCFLASHRSMTQVVWQAAGGQAVGLGSLLSCCCCFRIPSHCKCCCSLSSSGIFNMDVLAICSAQPAAASSQCRHPCCLWLWAGGQGGTGQFQPEEKAGGWEAVRGQLLRLLTICLKVIRVCAVWLKKYD